MQQQFEFTGRDVEPFEARTTHLQEVFSVERWFRLLLRILAGATGRAHEDEELNVEQAPGQQAGAKSTTPAPENAVGPTRAFPKSPNTMRNSGTLASGSNFDDGNNAVQLQSFPVREATEIDRDQMMQSTTARKRRNGN